MKEVYVKPRLNIESFALSQSVAAGCGAVPGGNSLGKPNHWSKSSCGWDMGNMVIWTDSNSSCDFKWEENDPWDGVCYNNPEGGNNIFSS